MYHWSITDQYLERMRKKERRDKSTIPQNSTPTSGGSHAIVVTKICAASVKLIKKKFSVFYDGKMNYQVFSGRVTPWCVLRAY